MPALRPTLSHSRARHYRRAGGPWDRGPLDAAGVGNGTIVDDTVRLSAGGVEAAVAALAGVLARAGARRGRCVSWQLPNSAAAAVLYRACWRLGVVAAPLHHRLGPAEVEAALAQVDPVVVLAAAGMPAADRAGAAVLRGPCTPDAVIGLLGAGPPVGAGAVAVRPSDLAVALFTSGSTGAPKAALHTHRGLGYKAATMVAVHGLGPGDAVLMPAPLAHVSGLLNGVLLPAAAGIPSVLMAQWDPDTALDRIEVERVSFMGAPPVFFSQMAASEGFSPDKVRSLRLVSTGGASVSPAFVDATAAAFDCRVKRTYGSTEAPTVTTSGPDDSLTRARDTDGHAVGEAELEVRDPDTAARRPAGDTGELWVRGPELFVGYADAGATARVVGRPGGWYRTGDLGTIDDQGWLRVVGRLSDIIIRAGENISASEVEAVLEAHPSVRHAVAVAVPDPAVGERVAAFVEASEPFDLEACRAWFATRGVTRFKTPEYVVQLDAVPTLAAGKPDRAALRTRAAGLAEGA
ncbi:MAG TPA: class I adenylate-forming enzyme family protein [Acidimicrobiales bacterium]|nr:class I adenylate-forming enzyme family protein [Acidimicrobiales bacterium]